MFEDYIKSEDIDKFILDKDAKRMIRDNIKNSEARFFINKLLTKYPDFLSPPKKLVDKED